LITTSGRTELYELRIPGLESRFFGQRKRFIDQEDKPDYEEETSSESEDEMIVRTGGKNKNEEAFLASANLCR